jgi:uncharacterized protein YuzE
MSDKFAYDYDKEADVLYITFSPGEKATTAVELNDNILLRFNRVEKRAIGLTLMDFSVLIQLTGLGPRSFPLSGLGELEPEWQETVIDILTSPPVNQILRVSTYMPSIAEAIPVASVEKPRISFSTTTGSAEPLHYSSLR